MLNNIRDIVLTVIVFIIFFVAMLLLIITLRKNQPLDLENFTANASLYQECVGDINQVAYDDSDIINMTTEQLVLVHEDLTTSNNCNSSFVVSNRDQLSVYATEMIDVVSEYYGDEEFGFLDAIYTAPSNYYANLNTTQEYLFFTMNTDETKLAAFRVTPNLDETISVAPIWDINTSSDLDLVQSYTEKLLVKYKEQI